MSARHRRRTQILGSRTRAPEQPGGNMTNCEQRSDRFTAIEDQYAGYTVYDPDGAKIGKVDDLFLDENDQPEYIGVKMGFLGLEGTSLIPMEVARVDDTDRCIELAVERSEEELRAGTREREAGALNVRKRVRTDREQISVPTRREEVSVERVPVEGREVSEAEIGEDEVSMPVVEEEVVVEKHPVIKEELR